MITTIIGIISGVVGTMSPAQKDGYKQGQIDAMTGQQVYCLNERLQWIDGEPDKELKCGKEK